MKALVFRCRDEAGFRPTRSALEGLSSFFHSDTLWSALVNVFSQCYPRPLVKALIAGAESGDWGLGSLLPCLERPDGSFFFLYPKPVGLGMFSGADANAWKAVQWVSGRVLDALAPGEIDLSWRLGPDILLHPSEFPPGGERFQARFFAWRDLPKVRVHSLTTRDSLYQQTQLHLRRRRVGRDWWQPHFFCPLFLGSGLDPALAGKLMGAFRLLVDTGLGGERSTGTGLFEDCVEVELDWPEVGGLRLNLSLVHPGSAGEWDCFLSYRYLVRGGGSFGGSDDGVFARKRVRMLAEGGLFRGEVAGRVVDISPDRNALPYPILRYGRCLSRPVGEALLAQFPDFVAAQMVSA